VVDPLSRTAAAEIVVANPSHKLRPGFFARVRLLVAEHRDVLLIPRDCLMRSGAKSYVFVVNGGRAARRDVRLGLSQGDQLEVVGGLQEGEEIVTVGGEMLKDGSEVKIVTKN